MAELAVNGIPSPGLPYGEFWCTRLDDGTIRVDHADPRIMIAAELLDAIALNGAIVDGTEAFALNARLDMTGRMHPATYVGAVLRIDGVNRTVIYRITDYPSAIGGYIGEWPD
jgi:hypothetical protein